MARGGLDLVSLDTSSPRDGWMPEVPKVTDDDEPSPWNKDLKDEDPPW